MSKLDLAALKHVPESVRLTGELIAGLDRCLLGGLGRLGTAEQDQLRRLVAVFQDTPLQTTLAQAVADLDRRTYLPRVGVALAVARAALQGAQHDALAAQAAEVLARPIQSGEPSVLSPTPLPQAQRENNEAGPIAVWRDSAQHWLMELVQTGFQHLDLATIAPFAATLTQLQDVPSLARWAALLTGFQDELLHALPITSLPVLPIYRWADLWTRSLVLSLTADSPAASGTRQTIAGMFTSLGVDVRQHDNFVSFVIHGVLEPQEADPSLVRITVSSYKVDALRGDELWRSVPRSQHPLLQALSEHRQTPVTGMTLLPAGDLLWTGEARKGKPVDIFDFAAARLNSLPLTTVPAADRHPLQLAIPIYIDDMRVETTDAGWVLEAGATRLPMLLPSSGSSLTIEHLGKAKRLVGLLRFDGGQWLVQPLGVDAGGKNGVVFTGAEAYEAATKKRKKDTLKILGERSSRLLRKKS